MSNINLINGDCLEYMRQMPDNAFDLAIVDPPYGISITNSGRLKKYNNTKKWDDEIPTKEYFEELFRVSRNQIIWGGNYFISHLQNCKCFLIWDKKQPDGVSFASCEFAWTSFGKVAKTFYLSPMNMDEKRIHTTQKPIKLYEWLLKNYAKEGDKILDTHLGSGSIAIACHNGGFDLTAYEIDKDYYDAAVTRYNNHKAQQRLF